MKRKKEIDWKDVWKKFNEWFGRTADCDWESQQKAIKRIVNKQLKDV